MSKIIIREMNLQDVSAVFSVEQAGYEFPWSKSLFEQAVQSTKFCTVIELDSEIVGYAIVSFVVGEAELLNICILPSMQGKGLARQLLDFSIEEATNKDNHEMYLEVRAGNTVALALYEKHDFNEIGCRKDYYPMKGGREDAILMARSLLF